MSARRLRRMLDEAYADGRLDGYLHDARDPGRRSESKDERFRRMAYDAGHAQSRSDLRRIAAIRVEQT